MKTFQEKYFLLRYEHLMWDLTFEQIIGCTMQRCYLLLYVQDCVEMATPSSALAWRIPGTGEPGGLPSVGSHRVGHDRRDLAAAAATAQACVVR